jgi:hypothetical protein
MVAVFLAELIVAELTLSGEQTGGQALCLHNDAAD